jgi:hypothetical protein
MRTFAEWLEEQEQLEENMLKTGALGLAAALGMGSAAQAKNNSLQQYVVQSQGLSDKPAIHHNIEADSIHMRSINTLKEVIKHHAQSKAYYSDFNIEIIESKTANEKSLIVEVQATVNAQNEEQAKQMVTRDIMSAVGKFSKGGNLQKMLDMRDLKGNMQVHQVENMMQEIPVKMKFKVSMRGIEEIK